MKKMLSILLVFALLIANVIGVYAQGDKEGPQTTSMSIHQDFLNDADIFYNIGDGEVQIDGAQADGAGKIWIHNIPIGENVTVRAEVKTDRLLDEIRVVEGDSDSPAYNGHYDERTNTYTFPAREMEYRILITYQDEQPGTDGDNHQPGPDENGDGDHQ